MIRVQPAQAGDAAWLAPRLRTADLREIQAATGETALGALERGVQVSDPGYTMVDAAGEPIALFGVVPNGGDKGIVWLLGSQGIEDNGVTFARISRGLLAGLHERYRVLWNFVDARNDLHLRWLAWCGFEIVRTIEDFGVEARPFHEVVHVREQAEEAR